MLKQFIPLKVKQTVNSYVAKHNINGDLNSPKNKIFVGLAADYGNLGDVAISYAQYHFLKKHFPDYEIIDVPISQTLANIRVIKKSLAEGDIFTTVGGGNFTNQYQEIEDFRLALVKAFPNNSFISFPQTIDFSNDDVGQASLKRSVAVYRQHKHFTMFARESISREKMNLALTNTVGYCPDIVLTLDKSKPQKQRNGVVCCIRNDAESNLSEFERETLLASIAEQHGINVTFTDTHIDANQLSWQAREKELDKIWTQFRGAELVVTDRLHGMIFSVITNTPCVVLTNSNHKIQQTYKDWLSQLPHVVLIEDYHLDLVLAEINRLTELPRALVKLPKLSKYYQPLIEAIANKR